MEVATNPPYLESYIYHKVKAGETMHSISTRYGVTIEQILEWNALRTSNIYVGQRLKLKAGTNNTTPAPQPVVTTPPRPVKKYYTVRSGDTFSRVADKYNLSQNELSKLNPRVNINRLTVGQRLRVR
jgi:LysM repeat protein